MRDNALYQQNPDSGHFDNRYVTKLLRNYRYIIHFLLSISLATSSKLKLSQTSPQVTCCYSENSQWAVLWKWAAGVCWPVGSWGLLQLGISTSEGSRWTEVVLLLGKSTAPAFTSAAARSRFSAGFPSDLPRGDGERRERGQQSFFL